MIDKADSDTLNVFVAGTVSHRGGLISTEDHRGYRYIDCHFSHGMVPDETGDYVHGSIHTITTKGFWSIVKRGIIGTFHTVSRKYLPLYVNEVDLQYNDRKNPDIFGAAIRAC